MHNLRKSCIIVYMGLKVCSLSSGSSGNCIFVSSDTATVLIDVGIPLSRVEKSLRVFSCPCDKASVIITHTHSDHISGVPSLTAKYGVPVYAHYLSRDIVDKRDFRADCLKEFGDNDFCVGDLLISPFRVSHDVPCVGFSVLCGGKKVSVMTDLGYVTENMINKVSDSDMVIIEANHDEELVKNNPKYPYILKKRILSAGGHLSNSACAAAAVKLAEGGVKQIMLAHLSRENNYPELAFSTVRDALSENGIKEGKDVMIEVAPASRLSGLFVIDAST